MRIVQISDLHAGLITPQILTRHILRLAQAENPDMVVLTGDVVSRARSYLPPIRPPAPPITEYARRLEPLMSELHAPHGVWAIPGNHDLMHNPANTNPCKRGDFGPVAQYLERAGVQILDNANVRLDNGLAVVGTDDLREGIPDVCTATRGIAPKAAQLILNHNPRIAALFADRNALILSGHTHGGQARLPEPLRLNPIDSVSSPWQSGWWRVGRAQLYVSVGAGHIGGPFRLGVPPEICVFTLHNSQPENTRTLPV
ncbi:UDP-2,3-diacylglucosamine pyrophosphatase LpxG [Abditibacteriota bacterium]|nr:UDP-2,3-diacylglucosamine pyrophosphatase LpxG [Abditibacteriota bacterium]